MEIVGYIIEADFVALNKHWYGDVSFIVKLIRTIRSIISISLTSFLLLYALD